MSDERMRKINIQWIAVKNLSVVWVEAQRKPDKKHAQWLADNFDPDYLDPLKVTLPNGTGIYHIIDGQHRRDAIELLWGSDERAPCEVMPTTDPVRAAQMFRAINNSHKRPTIIDDFKVAVAGQSPIEVDVNKIVSSFGYKIGEDIFSVSALVFVYRKCSPAILKEVLGVLQATWGKDDPNAFVAPIVRGYGAFLLQYQHQHPSLGHLKASIVKKGWSPGRLLGAVRTWRDTAKIPLNEAFKDILIQNYNFGLPKDKRLRKV